MNLETLENDDDNTGFEVDEITDAIKEESLDDSIRAVTEELTGETDELLQGDKSQEDEKPAIDASEAAKILASSKKGKGKKKTEVGEAVQNETAELNQPQQPKYLAPQRWTVEKKEEFNRLPDLAKEQVLDFWNGIEKHTTQAWQELSREQKRYENCNRILDHYTTKWNEDGFTGEAALAELCATRDSLINDPVNTIARICQKTGVTPQHIAQALTGQLPAQQQPAQYSLPNGQGVFTEDQIEQIIEKRMNSRQLQSVNQAAQQEVEQIRNQVTPEGNYLYPELWNNDFLQGCQPLVASLQKTHPGLAFGEYVKRAVFAMRGLQAPNQGSPSLNGSRLTREQELANLKAASVSIKGRGNASIPALSTAKPGESIEDSIRAVIAASQSGY